jgi:predicted phosphodiesterase
MPAEVLDLLRSLGPRARFVRGNCDRELVAAFDGTEDIGDPSPEWVALQRDAATRLSRAQRDFLDAQKLSLTVAIDGLGDVCFCHATPRSDTEIVTAETPEARLRDVLRDVKEDVVVCGHTHVQFDRTVGAKRVVNAGSLGLPYKGRRGAFWAMFSADVELRRTDYDVDLAVTRFRAAGVAAVDDTIIPALLEPPDPVETTAFFERMARKA